MWYIWQEDPSRHGRYGHDCGYFYPWTDFYKLAHGRNGRHSHCKSCNHFHRTWRYDYCRDHKALKQCEGCGNATYLEVDHCHETNRFRRWLCRS